MSHFFRTFYTQRGNLGKPLKVLEDGSTLYKISAVAVSVSTGEGSAKTAGNQSPLAETKLPPRIREYPTRSKLSDSQIQEIKELRQKDPETNTVLQLSKKFNTFPGFVLKHTKISNERREALALQHEREFEGMSLSKKKRLVDKVRRKSLW